jgi:hypothetical protein
LTYAITCDLSGATGLAACGCPDEHDPVAAGIHHGTCQLHPEAVHGVPPCPPGACCTEDAEDHSHHVETCDAVHGACPDPAGCRLWRNVRSHYADPDAAGVPEQCPGGHHGYGVEGCVVCHPLTITFTAASPVRLRRAES